jgi:drug/metabolite transporter (DMT)-like permease
MKHYFYAFGAILCWASLPAATGSGLAGLSTEELMFFSFTSAAIFLYLQDIILTRSIAVHIPGLKVSLLGVWGIFLYHYAYYQALSRTPLAEGAILATTWSFWIVVFSSLILFRKLKFAIILTAIVGMIGAAIVISSGGMPISSKAMLFSRASWLTMGYIRRSLFWCYWNCKLYNGRWWIWNIFREYQNT